jgi:hypothetical protein
MSYLLDDIAPDAHLDLATILDPPHPAPGDDTPTAH